MHSLAQAKFDQQFALNRAVQVVDADDRVTGDKCHVTETFDSRNVTYGQCKTRPTISNRNNLNLTCYRCERDIGAGETVYRIRSNWRPVINIYCEQCHLPKDFDQGVCETCKREVYYPRDRVYRRHIFCSEGCQNEHYSKVQREKRLKNRQKECNECGQAFTAPRSDTKFCTSACKQRAFRQRQRRAG